MRTTFLLIILFVSIFGHSQITKIMNVETPGSLSTLLTEDEKSIITNLTITGTIDVRDIKCMRDQMSVLSDIDLSESSIAAYDGGAVTYPYATSYPANELPAYSFRNYYLSQAKTTLITIILPKTLVSIGKSAFSTCPNLKSINIGNSITTIGVDAFIGCYGLNTVKMGSSVTTIGATAFEFCYALSNLTIGDHVIYIGAKAFDNCTSLSKLVIPNSMTTIGSFAFTYCTGLTELTIPSSTSIIEIGAFTGCNGIKTIYSLNPTPPVCDNCFSGVNGVTTVFVPASAVGAYKSSLVWSDCYYSQIKAITTTNINNPTNSKVKVYANHYEIIINGTNNGDIINIYTLTGKLIQMIKSSGEQVNIPIRTNNIYIVKTENESFKVSL